MSELEHRFINKDSYLNIMLDILVIFLYAFSQCRLGEAVECVKIDRCSCELDDGSGRSIDISKIGKQGGEPL